MDHEDVPTCTRVACALFAQGVYALRGWGELFEQRCSCFNCLTPELSRAVLWPRRRDNVPHGGAATNRSRLERIVSPQTCVCGLSQRCPPEHLVPVWNFQTQQLSPGAGHNPRVMAGAWARVEQGSSCWALCRCCGSAGLTPELSRAAERPRRWDNLSASAEAAKRTRLERIVRPLATFSCQASE